MFLYELKSTSLSQVYFEYTCKTMNVVEVDVDFVGSISLYEFVKWGLLCDL